MAHKHRQKMRDFINRLKDRIKRDQRTYRLYMFLRALVIVTMILAFISGNYEGAMVCILSLLLFLMPALFEKELQVDIPPLFEMIIYCFIFAAEILGEINHFYTVIPGWDTMLHTLNGFLCAAIGFAMADLLNRHSENINLSPFYLAVTAFCFSMTVGVCWEFFEFSMDQFNGKDMQKDFIVQSFNSCTLDETGQQRPIHVENIEKTIIETADGEYIIEGGYLDIGIIDTMKDLLVNLVGAVTFSTIGYFYVKNRDEKNIAGKLMLRVQTPDEVDEINKFIDEQEEQRAEKKTKKKRKPS